MRLSPIDAIPIGHAHFAVASTSMDSAVHQASVRVQLVIAKKRVVDYHDALARADATTSTLGGAIDAYFYRFADFARIERLGSPPGPSES